MGDRLESPSGAAAFFCVGTAARAAITSTPRRSAFPGWTMSLVKGASLVEPPILLNHIEFFVSGTFRSSKHFTTFRDGCLGSGNDEGRSEMR